MTVKNNRGLTLIEVLAAVVIAAIIMFFVTSIYTSTLKNYENIKVETELRNEADLLLTKFMREIYVIPEKNITYIVDQNDTSYLTIKKQQTNSTIDSFTGIKDNQLYINNEVQQLNNNIKIIWSNSKLLKGENDLNETVYTLSLTLENPRGLRKVFSTSVPPIKSKKEEEEL